MAKKVINQKASDNTYYHPDFHIALNHGIEYLNNTMGEDAVREYLRQFVNAYHAGLKKDFLENGLRAIKEHYEKIYEIEKAVYNMHISENELIIHLTESPAVMHIRAGNHSVSSVYRETVATVNKEICRNTDYDCDVVDYNNENGAYKLRFFKRDI
jgi:hypothetical protein